MNCRVKRPPLYHVTLTWEVDYLVKRPRPLHVVNGSVVDEGVASDSGDLVILNRDVTRGGVRVITGRDKKGDQVVSQLSLSKAMTSDVGNYTCRLSSIPPNGDQRGLYDTISVHVLQGENSEAIQSNSGPRLLSRNSVVVVSFYSANILMLQFLAS